ncbi:MAG: carboxypeptidase regulatory-like domain-containing protein [Blastocatellia bacterium]
MNPKQLQITPAAFISAQRAMPRRRFLRGVSVPLALAILLLSSGGRGLAQTNLGSISGTVTDNTGAVIPGAKVKVNNVGTRAGVTLVTSEQGAFTASALQPTIYEVTVELPGFKKRVITGVKVDTAQTTTVNVTLELGAVSETTTITAEEPVLNSSSGTSEQTITERQIRDLPIGERSVLALALTVPNVTGFAESEDPQTHLGIPSPGVNMTLGGGRPGESSMLADGVNNTGVGIARQVVSFSPDVVQEFTVKTSAFSAEYGSTGGGVINTTTKSGTNQVKGTASWYNRNPAFAARPFSQETATIFPSAKRLNVFGLIVGGPVVLPKKLFGPLSYDGHNRTFFFAAFEPRWSSDVQSFRLLLPDAGMRRGDFSDAVVVSTGITRRETAQRLGIPITRDLILYRQFDLVTGPDGKKQLRRIVLQPGQTYQQFPGNIIPPEYLDAVSRKLSNEILFPAGDPFKSAAGTLFNFDSTSTVRIREDRLTLRFDHKLSENNQLSFRYTDTPIFGERFRGPSLDEPAIVIPSDFSASKQYLGRLTTVFSPRAVNDLRVNYTGGNYTRANPLAFQTRNFSTELGLPSGAEAGLPRFDIGELRIGQDPLAGTNGLRQAMEETYNIADTLSYTRGNMTFKIGADLLHQRQQSVDIGTYAGGNYVFSAQQTNSNGLAAGATGGHEFVSFLLGIPNTVNLRSAVVPYDYRWRSGAFFIQNDWKVRPNLTLNLGLRYSLQLPRVEANNLQGFFDAGRTLTVPITNTVIRRAAAGNPIVPVPAGVLPTTTQVPVFTYAGKDGRSRYLLPVDYNNFAPRFGVNWAPGLFGLNRAGGRGFTIGGGYGLSHLAMTGQDRFPSPDLGGAASDSFTFNAGQVDPQFAMRLSSNPPAYTRRDPNLDIPADGIVGLQSLNLAGETFFVDPATRVPSAHNWNLTLSYEVLKNTVVSVSYAGSYSSSLFLPGYSVNFRDFSRVEKLLQAGIDPELLVQDPLGRLDSAGRIRNVRLGDLTSPYLGFTGVQNQWDTSAMSVRHAGYVSVQRRVGRGLSFTGNYTFGKTIDTASSGGASIRNSGFSALPQSQLSFGGRLEDERSVAIYDVTHNITSTFNWDAPIGRGRALFSQAPGLVDAIIGGWKFAGIATARSGLPLLANLNYTNYLGSMSNGFNQIRVSLVPDVSLKNPDYDRKNCAYAAGCEPWYNPSAFMLPPKGQLGTAPKVISEFRYPWRYTFDLSLQKNFYLGGDRKRYLQFRADIFNVFNHANLKHEPNQGTWRMFSQPSESDITATDYNSWVAANPQRGLQSQSTAAGAPINPDYQRVLDITRNARGSSFALPNDFFSIRLPRKFATTQPNNFDITTPEGLKLYRLRQAYNPQFGHFKNFPPETFDPMRNLQFAVKLYF